MHIIITNAFESRRGHAAAVITSYLDFATIYYNLGQIFLLWEVSYTHNHLKRFIALQNFTPVVQRLHPFTTPTSRTRDRWIAISDSCFRWRIGPVSDMIRQGLRDGNLEECRRGANHYDARNDLADQWWKSHDLPLCVVLIKGRYCFCY